MGVIGLAVCESLSPAKDHRLRTMQRDCVHLYPAYGCSTVVLMFHLSDDNSRDRYIKGS